MAEKIPAAAGNGLMLLKPSTWEALRQQLDGLAIIPDPEQFEITRRNGKLFFRQKAQETDPGRGGGGSGNASCNFGEIITEDGEYYIRGGRVRAGKKTWVVAKNHITATTGEFEIWIKVGVTANTNPTNIATLSGLKTSTSPTWESASGSDPIEDQVIPEIFPTSDPGSGTAIIPIGRLTFVDEVPQLAATGCGDITVLHCPGNLDHRRGNIAIGSDSPP